MIKLLKAIYKFPRKIKRRLNYRLFKKYAHVGKDLDLNSDSYCSADVPGSVKIGEKCRIFAHLYTQNDGKITIGAWGEVIRLLYLWLMVIYFSRMSIFLHITARGFSIRFFRVRSFFTAESL